MALGHIGLMLEEKLRRAFQPVALSVWDESHQHAGHAGAHPSGESHFRVRIVSESFRGLSRVAQHRMVNEVLAEELKTRVHALALETAVPDANAKCEQTESSAQRNVRQLIDL